MITQRNTTVLASDYQSTEQLQKFLKHCTGAVMTPVQGKDDTFWIHGDKRGTYHQKKYYKIEFGFVELKKVTDLIFRHQAILMVGN